VWASAADGAQNAPTDSAQEPAIELDPRNLGSVRFRDILERQLDSGEPVAVPGALPKVSAARLTIPVREGTPGRHYILKLSTPEMPRLVENECFFMRAARAVGIQTARVKRVKDAVREADLLVERFDRRPFQASKSQAITDSAQFHRKGAFERLHQEGAVQLLDRYPGEKYRVPIGEVMTALDVRSAPVVERLRLLERLAFAYLIADGDLHGKNITVLTRDGRTTLAPAYDVRSTLPYGDNRQALRIEGRDQELCRPHFLALGERHGLRAPAVEKVLARLTSKLGCHREQLPSIGFATKQTRDLERTLVERIGHLSAQAG